MVGHPFDLAWAILKNEESKPIIELDQPTGYFREDVMDGDGDGGGRTRMSPTYEGDEGRSDPYRNTPRGTESMSRGPLRSRKRGDPTRSPRFIRPGFRGPAMPLTDKSASRRSQ